MSLPNRLWAQHVKKKSWWARLPRTLRIILSLAIIASLIGGAYAAVQVILSSSGSFRVVGTSLVWTETPTLMNQNITNPMTQYYTIQLNSTWGLQNTGGVVLSIHYTVSGMPANFTLTMLSSNTNFQGQSLAPGKVVNGGTFNLTIGHFDPTALTPFTLTVEGCYPVGIC